LANKACRLAARLGPADRPPGRQEKACRSVARPPRKSLQIGRPAAKRKPADRPPGRQEKACRPGPHLKAAAKGGLAA